MNNNQKKALFIGLTVIDIQYFVEHYPQPNTKLKTEAPLIAVGGPAANAAITFSVLGGKADFLTCIGENSFSQVILNDFEKFGVTVIDQLKGAETDPIVSAVITTLTNSERTIITHHPNELAAEPLHDSLSPSNYDLIFVDGFYPELGVEILAEAKRLHIPVVFDGGSWKAHLPGVLKFVDVAICSGNFHPPKCTSSYETISFLKSFGITEVAISKGEENIESESFNVEIEKVNAVDSLGAGDVLHGAFCWYWLQSFNFKMALEKASKVATFSVKFKGTHQWIHHYISNQ